MDIQDSSIQSDEVEKFANLAETWWDPKGPFAPLHRFNPVRLEQIRQILEVHFGLDAEISFPLKGLSLLDVGCGGGLISEPMARLGAKVIGLDAAHKNIETAKLHAQYSDLIIDYRQGTAEGLAISGEEFDIVLALEIIEHVKNPHDFIQSCAHLVKPDGIVICATINRTLKAFLLSILGAEYILRWLPIGTHQYEKFVRPSEMEAAFNAAGLIAKLPIGFHFHPLFQNWRTGKDVDVNYMMAATKPF